MGRVRNEGLWAQWRERVGRFERGPLSVVDFCAWEGVSVSAFRSWRRKLEREEEAARTRPSRARPSSVSPHELANLVLMNLLTWGAREPPGRLVMPWDRLATELMQLTGADATELWDALQGHPELVIDLVGDRITCTDPGAVRRRLRAERR